MRLHQVFFPIFPPSFPFLPPLLSLSLPRPLSLPPCVCVWMWISRTFIHLVPPDQLREARLQGDIETCTCLVRENLDRGVGGLENPLLYRRCNTGTKDLIEEYIEEMVCQIQHISDDYIPGTLLYMRGLSAIYKRDLLVYYLLYTSTTPSTVTSPTPLLWLTPLLWCYYDVTNPDGDTNCAIMTSLTLLLWCHYYDVTNFAVICH